VKDFLYHAIARALRLIGFVYWHLIVKHRRDSADRTN
jgi:hypothetical protein